MKKLMLLPILALIFVSCRKDVTKKFDRSTYIDLEMVKVEGGVYEYEFDETSCSAKIDDFSISKYEITQEIYKSVTGKNPSYFSDDDKPVENISFVDAVKFCNELSKIKNLPEAYNIYGELIDSYGEVTKDLTKVKGYRLLTEAEWEYAYIGGNKTQNYTYSGSNDLGEAGWFIDNSEYILEDTGYEDKDGNPIMNKIYKTNPVGRKKANELGIYDMAGNVYEYTTNSCDVYSSDKGYNYDKNNKDILIKGGSSRGEASTCKKDYRNSDYANIVSPENNGSLPYMGIRIGKSM